jgi:hypothetical protein
MKLRSLLFALILSALFLSGGMAARAQTLDQTLSGCNGAAPLRTIQANPSNYKSLIPGLIPGDRLQLAAGTYTQGLNLWNKNGQANKCIVIEGPASGSPAIFTGSSAWNIVSFNNSSYIAVRNLTLDGLNLPGNGVKAEAGSTYTHHILLERLNMKNFQDTVQNVGVNTKSPAWNWVVRYNTITSTGTGMYFGGWQGQFEFANSLIEHNLIHGTLGYNIEIKHQLSRNTSIGIPSTATTIIRHNVFSKAANSLSGAEARPNLLVGHWPLSGAGSSDIYQIYGNVFDENPYESLFQGEGNVALHDNLFVNRTGPAALRIQPHNDYPRQIEIFHNTIVSNGTGITIYNPNTAYQQRVIGNVVFAGTPITGGTQTSNLTGTYASAATYLNNPTAPLGSGLDLYPKIGKVTGTAIDTTFLSSLLEWDKDFNSLQRITTFRGAYSGEGVNPGWQPALAIKP